MSRGGVRDMHPVDDRGNSAGLHGRHSIRETVSTEEENADLAVLEKRCDLSKGRPVVPDVPCR